MEYIYITVTVNIVLTLFTVFKIFGKSYLAEKGKNLATKQDIEDITLKIEGVKVLYSKEIESLRASLLQGVNKKHLFLQKSTDILLNYYDKVLILNFGKLSKSFGDFISEEDQKMSAVVKHIGEVNDLFDQLMVDYHRLSVFLDGKNELMVCTSEIITSVLKIKKVFNNHTGERKIALFKEMTAFRSKDFQDYEKAVYENNAVSAKYYEELKNPYETFQKQISSFIEKLTLYLS